MSWPEHAASLAAHILDVLPQTQCQRCGYDDCAGYARAVASGTAQINQCPPGGAEGIRRLAALTGQPVIPLDPQYGAEGPRGVAWIDETWCIGCTLCIKACPVDCIIGTNKAMHTVIESDCTGCELCVEACPVDCIHMENVSGEQTGWDAWTQAQADAARQAHGQQRRRQSAARLHKKKSRGQRRVPSPRVNAHATDTATPESRLGATQSSPKPEHKHSLERKRAAVAAALARARARRGAT